MGRKSKRAIQICTAVKIVRTDEEYKLKERIKNLDYARNKLELESPNSTEVRLKKSLQNFKKRLQDSEFKKANLTTSNKRYKDPVLKKTLLKASNQRYQNPVLKETILKASNQRYQDPVLKKTILKASNQRYQDPVIKETILKASNNRYQDPVFKATILNSSKKRQNKLREEDPLFKTHQNNRMCRSMKKRRAQSDSSSQSSVHNAISICYKNITNRTMVSSYRLNERQRLNDIRQGWDTLVSDYLLKRTQGLSEICVSCLRLRFPSSINKVQPDVLRNLGIIISTTNDSSVKICTSCHPHIRKSKIPPLYTGNGYTINEVPKSVSSLNQIEKQMVSLRLPFMKIFKCLRSDGQLKIKGPVINVPIDLTKTTSILPRRAENLSALKIMKVKLKRKSCMKQHYLYQNVRPALVIHALNDLLGKPLYKDAQIDKDWLAHVTQAIGNLNLELDTYDNEEPDDHDGDHEQLNPGVIDSMIDNCDYISFAPGEGMSPLSILIDDHAEEKAFPDLFGGYPRTNKTPLKNYSKVVRSELLNVDRRFAADTSNLFFKCKVLVQKQIASNIQIVLRKNKTENTVAGDVANPTLLRKMIDNDQGYQMLHNVQNSPSYLAAMRKNVLAMVRQEGQPTLFLTFSPSESTWTDLLMILYKLRNNDTLSADRAASLTYAQKSDLIRQDPVVCATYFDHRFRSLFKLIKSRNGIFKEHSVQHFFYRVEYQHRGSPHVHMLLWLEKAPVFDPAKPETFNACVELIEKYVTCMVDETSAAHGYLHKNTHNHTHTCYRSDKDKENKKCRFNIPYPPMNETCILTPLSENNSNPSTRKHRLEKYNILLQFLRDYKDIDTSKPPTLDEILQKLSIPDINEYKSIIRTGIKRPTVFLRRTIKERMISGFNEKLFPLWQSNMDIQFILDVYSCVRYVIEYIGKSQRGISKLMRDIVENLKSSTDLPVKEQLWKIASSFSGSQEISAQEAVYTCLGMKQSNSSTGHIFINTSHPDKRTRMLKSKAVRGEMDPQSTDIYMDGLLEHYSCRPNCLEQITLAEFGSNYEVRGIKITTNINSDSEANDASENELDTIYTIDSTLIGKPNKYIHKRKVRKIIRYMRFNIDKNEQDFFRENVMLFLPWRDEKSDLLNIDCKEVYEKNVDKIKNMYYQFNKIEEKQLEDNVNNVEAEQDRNENGIQDEKDWVPDDRLLNDIGDYVEPTDNPDDVGPKDGCKFSVNKIDNEQFNTLVECLNEGQRQLLYHTTHILRDQIWGNDAAALRTFVTGPAGAGKSMLIRALAQSVIRIANLRPDIDDLSLAPVLLTAPTGKAAYGIRGITLHSAFSLPLNQYAGVLPKLSSDISNGLRCQLANVKLLIIDEISMVGIKTLGYIDQRLRSILRINKPFGDINIIVFGDFFQLAPVLSTPLYDSFHDIMTKYSSAIEMISIKSIWETFKFYELTEIMRQKDDKEFALMLTKLARGQLEEAGIKYFQNLVTHLDISFQPQVMHLWGTNKDVDDMNIRVLNTLNQVSFVSEAIDTSAKRADIESAKKLPRQKTMGLPLRIVLKETAKYMVIANISTEDGIVNGAIGELMQINKGQTVGGKEVAKRVWIKFDDSEVGSLTRQQCKGKFTPKGEQVDDWCNWTPVDIIKLEFQLGNAGQRKITRMQLPIVEALALTVHKSQGATYEFVSFHIPQQYLKCNMLYVGCSRATSAQGLRIDHFPNKPPRPSVKVQQEMCRLRSSSCALVPWFSKMLNKTLYCISHNIRSMRKYEGHVNADRILLQGKLMFFQETGSKSTDIFNIKDHIECCRVDSIHTNGKSGSICFVDKSINLTEITCTPTLVRVKNAHLEALEVCIGNITYIGIYVSQNFPIQTLCQFIQHRAMTNTHNVFVGDFNIRFDKQPTLLNQVLQKYNYKILVTDITTDYGTTIDNVITNLNLSALVYESLISHHRPILLTDIDTCVENVNNIEIEDDDNINTITGNSVVEQIHTTINNIDGNVQTRLIRGFSNNDNVSCYANSVIQIIFHCELLVTKIRNNQLGPTLRHCLQQYENNNIVPETRSIREYLTNEFYVYNDIQQQDCVHFLESLMNRHRNIFDTLFGFQELYTNHCNLCNHTTNDIVPLNLIKHLAIPQNKHQTLQQLLHNDQNAWSSIHDYRCTNCHDTGGYERKCAITSANEYIFIQLKLFTANRQNNITKITDLKLSAVPAENIKLSTSWYKPYAAIFHKGEELNSGHYIAYLKQTNSKWVCANDIKICTSRWPIHSKDVYVIILKKV
jgi:hypothetical protein